MVKRCGYCNMRFHKCLCSKKKPAALDVREERPPGQSTITWSCSPKEQLSHWRNIANRQSSQDRRQSAFSGEKTEGSH